MILAHAIRLLLVAALAGVVVRGWHRRCWAWVAYTVAMIVLGGLMSLWPERFWNGLFWRFSRDVYALFRLLVAVEIAAHVFAAFPRVAARARILELGLLLTALWPMLWGSRAGFDGFAAWHLILAGTTVWIFAITALLVSFHNLPVHPWHRAIMVGMTVHLSVFVLLLAMLRAWGYSVERYAPAGWADLALACWWNAVVWARSRARVPVPEGARA